MHCAVYTALSFCAPFDVCVIQNKEVSLISVCHIEVDIRIFEVLQVLLDRDEEFSVIAVLVIGL